jgi:hypothetical protein
MRYRLSAFFLGIILVFLSIPFVIGVIAERKIKSLPTKDSISSYERSWFTSTIQGSTSVDIDKDAFNLNDSESKDFFLGGKLDCKYTLKIHHGPFIFEKGKVSASLGKVNSQMSLPVSVDFMLQNQQGDAKNVTYSLLIEQRDELCVNLFSKDNWSSKVFFQDVKLPELDILSSISMETFCEGDFKKAFFDNSIFIDELSFKLKKDGLELGNALGKEITYKELNENEIAGSLGNLKFWITHLPSEILEFSNVNFNEKKTVLKEIEGSNYGDVKVGFNTESISYFSKLNESMSLENVKLAVDRKNELLDEDVDYTVLYRKLNSLDFMKPESLKKLLPFTYNNFRQTFLMNPEIYADFSFNYDNELYKLEVDLQTTLPKSFETEFYQEKMEEQIDVGNYMSLTLYEIIKSLDLKWNLSQQGVDLFELHPYSMIVKQNSLLKGTQYEGSFDLKGFFTPLVEASFTQ